MPSSWGFETLSTGEQQQQTRESSGHEGASEQMEVVEGGGLEEVEQKEVAFLDVATTTGAKLKLSQPWPEDQLPPITASLLSIASKRGLLAAAGPDTLTIVGTQKVRQQYLARRKDDEEADKVRPLEADVRIATPRLSHVAFSPDESYLVISAEQGGGLAVYNSDSLSTSAAQPVFQIATGGKSVRQLLLTPNQDSEFSHLVGVVQSDGKLLLANLRTRTLASTGGNSTIFHEGVSSAAWSKFGKQIIAGLTDGTCVQIDPQGNVKDRIPRPPQLTSSDLQHGYDDAQGLPITSIVWLSTYEFLLVFSPSYPKGMDSGRIDSIYIIARRTKTTPFTFHKFDVDPCPPFGMVNRTPTHQFLLRLNDWLNITDLLITGSPSSTEVNVLARFKQNEQKGLPGDFFTAKIPEDRGQRIIMPYSDELGGDVSAVGMALDLSSLEVAPRPIYNEADLFPHSTIPLPALCLLGHDGILMMWWVTYNDAIKEKAIYSGMIHKDGKFAKYKKFNGLVVETDPNNPHAHEQDKDVSDDEQDVGDVSLSRQAPGLFPSSPSSNNVATRQQQPALPAFGQSGFPKTTTTSITAHKPAFGQPTAPGFGSTSALGQKQSPWVATVADTTTASKDQSVGHTFGQPSPSALGSSSSFGAFGKQSQPVASTVFTQATNVNTMGSSVFGQPSTPVVGSVFGRTSTPTTGTATFGQASISGTGSAFGQTSKVGGSATTFGQPSTPSTNGAFGQSFSTSRAFPPPTSMPFGGNVSAASPFAAIVSKNSNPFAAHTQQRPTFTQETSAGSTATLGSSSASGSFGTGSTFKGSSFVSKSALSQESTMKDDEADDSFEAETTGQNPSELFGTGIAGFKLGSGFKGDGTAKDDVPKPTNPGPGMFGAGFGEALGHANRKPVPFIKQEPGSNEQPSTKDILAADLKSVGIPSPSYFTQSSKTGKDDAPLPPDFIATRSKGSPEDAPLPPDPSKFPSQISIPPFKESNSFDVEGDVPIAGSPPVDVTNSQSFLPVEGSRVAGPLEEGSESWDDEEAGNDEAKSDDRDQHDDGEDDEEEDDHDDEDEDEEDVEEYGEDPEEEEPYEIQDPEALTHFKKRIQPPSPRKSDQKPQRTPQSSEKKTDNSSYTPAGFPKGPHFPPTSVRPQLSPRSPSPQRAVTSPIARVGGVPTILPSQIKTHAVPPAQPLERPVLAPPSSKPVEPTAGELQDEADARLKAYLAAPIEPTKELPHFYTHTDYDGTIEKDGLGGQTEKVFRDVNSMIDVVGLNGKGLKNFLTGHDVAHEGDAQRTRENLEHDEIWSLGDMSNLGRILNGIANQLEAGKLQNVRQTTEYLADEQRETLKVKAKTTEIRKHMSTHTDPGHLAMQKAAQLAAETQTQQSELRRDVQNVQRLVSKVEEKMTMLRADLASKSTSNNSETSGERPAVPTVEAVINTILKMTTMVEQKSGDIDVLELQIKRLPKGLASLRLDDDYEDGLAGRLAGNNLLASSSARTPPRGARMAANGDPLGMSGMFGTFSRFQTPPSATASARRSTIRFTPEASLMSRSMGSLGASTRKKMTDVTTAEVEEYHHQLQRRRSVLTTLSSKIAKGGVRVVKVE